MNIDYQTQQHKSKSTASRAIKNQLHNTYVQGLDAKQNLVQIQIPQVQILHLWGSFRSKL